MPSAFDNTGTQGPPGPTGPGGPVGPVDAAVPAPGGRLTLSATDPRPTADATTGTVYYLSDVNNRVPLWNGTQWLSTLIGNPSFSLGTVNVGSVFDVFGFLSSGVLAIEKTAWTNPTSRGYALVMPSSTMEYATKPGDKTRLYLGTICASTGTGTTTTVPDTQLFRGVWNMYNRRQRSMLVIETTDNWSYFTPAWRKANATAANRVQFVLGLPSPMDCNVQGIAYSSVGNHWHGNGIGVDNELTSNAQLMFCYTLVNLGSGHSAYYRAEMAAGFHFFQWMEYGGTSGAGGTLFYGDLGPTFATLQQAGLRAVGDF